MKTKNLTIYQTYSLQPIAISDRSSLYSLEPKAIGTAYVESLTSYIQRLAMAHCVHTGTLISKKFAPVLERKAKDVAAVCSNRFGRAINGMGVMALDMLEALKVLTLRDDLHLLTLLPFTEVIHPRNLCRPVKAWCSLCLEQWRDSKQEIYEPLLWTLQAVKICPRHLHPLSEQCPYCKESYVPIAWYSRPGYCSKCQQWLGNTACFKEKSCEVLKIDEVENNIWTATNIGALLSASSKLNAPLTRNQLADTLLKCINNFTQGNKSRFSHLLGYKRPITVRSWLVGKKLPSITSLLHICFCLNISLLDLVTGNINTAKSQESSLQQGQNSSDFLNEKSSEVAQKTSSQSIFSSAREPKKQVLESQTNKPQRITSEDLQRIQASLEIIFEEAAFKSLEKVANDFNISQTTLCKYFPHQCKEISKAYVDKKMKEKIQRIKPIFEEIIEQSDYPPPLTEVCRILKISASNLRKVLPDLCSLLHKKRASHRQTCIDQRTQQAETTLKTVLEEDKRPPLSLKQVAETYGYSTQILTVYAPNLCHQVSTRYSEYIKDERKLKIQQICKEVEAITFKLYAGGIYPSLSRVKTFIPSGYFREEEVINAWKAIMHDLNLNI